MLIYVIFGIWATIVVSLVVKDIILDWWQTRERKVRNHTIAFWFYLILIFAINGYDWFASYQQPAPKHAAHRRIRHA